MVSETRCESWVRVSASALPISVLRAHGRHGRADGHQSSFTPVAPAGTAPPPRQPAKRPQSIPPLEISPAVDCRERVVAAWCFVIAQPPLLARFETFQRRGVGLVGAQWIDRSGGRNRRAQVRLGRAEFGQRLRRSRVPVPTSTISRPSRRPRAPDGRRATQARRGR